MFGCYGGWVDGRGVVDARGEGEGTVGLDAVANGDDGDLCGEVSLSGGCDCWYWFNLCLFYTELGDFRRRKTYEKEPFWENAFGLGKVALDGFHVWGFERVIGGECAGGKKQLGRFEGWRHALAVLRGEIVQLGGDAAEKRLVCAEEDLSDYFPRY